MPVRMLNFLRDPIPPSLWARGPMLETEEWKEIEKALNKELGPQEYLAVEFPPGHPIHKKMKRPQGSVWHKAKKRVKQLGLDYDVFNRGNVTYIVGRNGKVT